MSYTWMLFRCNDYQAWFSKIIVFAPIVVRIKMWKSVLLVGVTVILVEPTSCKSIYKISSYHLKKKFTISYTDEVPTIDIMNPFFSTRHHSPYRNHGAEGSSLSIYKMYFRNCSPFDLKTVYKITFNYHMKIKFTIIVRYKIYCVFLWELYGILVKKRAT